MNRPSICIGIRLATLAIAPDARPLAVGITAWDIATLRYIDSYFDSIDFHDPESKDMCYVDPSTLDWWEGRLPSSPSKEAYRACWSGGQPMRSVLERTTAFIEKLNEFERIIVSKPPAFDMPILTNVYGHLGMWRGMFAKPSAVDSGHMAERGLATLGFDKISDAEATHYSFGQPFVQHHPRFESAKIAYITARYYHLLNIIRKSGYDTAKAAHEQMLTGEYAGFTSLGD